MKFEPKLKKEEIHVEKHECEDYEKSVVISLADGGRVCQCEKNQDCKNYNIGKCWADIKGA